MKAKILITLLISLASVSSFANENCESQALAIAEMNMAVKAKLAHNGYDDKHTIAGPAVSVTTSAESQTYDFNDYIDKIPYLVKVEVDSGCSLISLKISY